MHMVLGGGVVRLGRVGEEERGEWARSVAEDNVWDDDGEGGDRCLVSRYGRKGRPWVKDDVWCANLTSAKVKVRTIAA